MMIIPKDQLHCVAGGGPGMDALKEYAAAIPLAGGLGAGIGVNSAIKAAGGLRVLGTLGAGTAAAAVGGLATAAVVGYSLGKALMGIPGVREGIGDMVDYCCAGH